VRTHRVTYRNWHPEGRILIAHDACATLVQEWDKDSHMQKCVVSSDLGAYHVIVYHQDASTDNIRDAYVVSRDIALSLEFGETVDIAQCVYDNSAMFALYVATKHRWIHLFK